METVPLQLVRPCASSTVNVKIAQVDRVLRQYIQLHRARVEVCAIFEFPVIYT